MARSLIRNWINAAAQRFMPNYARSSRKREFRAQVRAEATRIVRTVRAKYDAAATTDENRKHWAQADDLSANAANSAYVRQILRRRSRYERDNNSYCHGIVSTLANDLIGTGPRLQLMTEKEELNRVVQREFGFWCDAVDLAGKLQIADMARHIDGEGFDVLATNYRLATPVKLDLIDIEADQFATPLFTGLDPLAVDGIKFDRFRNPITYDLLQSHPGDLLGTPLKATAIPAAQVLHWFTPNRPGQLRGIPTITPALPLFAQLRRYCLAVLAAAEIAAEIAAFVQTNMPPNDPSGNPDNDFELLEIVRGQIMSLPQGWQIGQLNPGQPTTGFGEFCNQILKEIARCLNMPWGLAAGDTSNYSYAGGRLDLQVYQRKIKVDRARLERRILDKLFKAWLDEAILIDGYLPLDSLPPYGDWAWQWHWDGFEHVDPTKEASAIKTLLEINATTLEAVYAAKGLDWYEALKQLAKERKAIEELGLIVAPATSPAPTEQPEPIDPTDEPNAVPARTIA